MEALAKEDFRAFDRSELPVHHSSLSEGPSLGEGGPVLHSSPSDGGRMASQLSERGGTRKLCFTLTFYKASPTRRSIIEGRPRICDDGWKITTLASAPIPQSLNPGGSFSTPHSKPSSWLETLSVILRAVLDTLSPNDTWGSDSALPAGQPPGRTSGSAIRFPAPEILEVRPIERPGYLRIPSTQNSFQLNALSP